jgi:hypothetical protein
VADAAAVLKMKNLIRSEHALTLLYLTLDFAAGDNVSIVALIQACLMLLLVFAQSSYIKRTAYQLLVSV